MTLASALFGSMGSFAATEIPRPRYTGDGHQPHQGRGRSRNNRRKNPFRGMTYSAHHGVPLHIERSVA